MAAAPVAPVAPVAKDWAPLWHWFSPEQWSDWSKGEGHYSDEEYRERAAESQRLITGAQAAVAGQEPGSSAYWTALTSYVTAAGAAIAQYKMPIAYTVFALGTVLAVMSEAPYAGQAQEKISQTLQTIFGWSKGDSFNDLFAWLVAGGDATATIAMVLNVPGILTGVNNIYKKFTDAGAASLAKRAMYAFSTASCIGAWVYGSGSAFDGSNNLHIPEGEGLTAFKAFSFVGQMFLYLSQSGTTPISAVDNFAKAKFSEYFNPLSAPEWIKAFLGTLTRSLLFAYQGTTVTGNPTASASLAGLGFILTAWMNFTSASLGPIHAASEKYKLATQGKDMDGNFVINTEQFQQATTPDQRLTAFDEYCRGLDLARLSALRTQLAGLDGQLNEPLRKIAQEIQEIQASSETPSVQAIKISAKLAALKAHDLVKSNPDLLADVAAVKNIYTQVDKAAGLHDAVKAVKAPWLGALRSLVPISWPGENKSVPGMGHAHWSIKTFGMFIATCSYASRSLGNPSFVASLAAIWGRVPVDNPVLQSEAFQNSMFGLGLLSYLQLYASFAQISTNGTHFVCDSIAKLIALLGSCCQARASGYVPQVDVPNDSGPSAGGGGDREGGALDHVAVAVNSVAPNNADPGSNSDQSGVPPHLKGQLDVLLAQLAVAGERKFEGEFSQGVAEADAVMKEVNAIMAEAFFDVPAAEREKLMGAIREQVATVTSSASADVGPEEPEEEVWFDCTDQEKPGPIGGRVAQGFSNFSADDDSGEWFDCKDEEELPAPAAPTVSATTVVPLVSHSAAETTLPFSARAETAAVAPPPAPGADDKSAHKLATALMQHTTVTVSDVKQSAVAAPAA